MVDSVRMNENACESAKVKEILFLLLLLLLSAGHSRNKKNHEPRPLAVKPSLTLKRTSCDHSMNHESVQ